MAKKSTKKQEIYEEELDLEEDEDLELNDDFDEEEIEIDDEDVEIEDEEDSEDYDSEDEEEEEEVVPAKKSKKTPSKKVVEEEDSEDYDSEDEEEVEDEEEEEEEVVPAKKSKKTPSKKVVEEEDSEEDEFEEIEDEDDESDEEDEEVDDEDELDVDEEEEEEVVSAKKSKKTPSKKTSEKVAKNSKKVEADEDDESDEDESDEEEENYKDYDSVNKSILGKSSASISKENFYKLVASKFASNPEFVYHIFKAIYNQYSAKLSAGKIKRDVDDAEIKDFKNMTFNKEIGRMIKENFCDVLYDVLSDERRIKIIEKDNCTLTLKGVKKAEEIASNAKLGLVTSDGSTLYSKIYPYVKITSSSPALKTEKGKMVKGKFVKLSEKDTVTRTIAVGSRKSVVKEDEEKVASKTTSKKSSSKTEAKAPVKKTAKKSKK